MNILTTIIVFILMLAVILAANLVCKKFIFGRVRINKWIPLAIAVVLFAIPMILSVRNVYVSSGISVLAVLFFLWYMDITQKGVPKKKEKQILIKPKAKPNRVKKNNKE